MWGSTIGIFLANWVEAQSLVQLADRRFRWSFIACLSGWTTKSHTSSLTLSTPHSSPYPITMSISSLINAYSSACLSMSNDSSSIPLFLASPGSAQSPAATSLLEVRDPPNRPIAWISTSKRDFVIQPLSRYWLILIDVRSFSSPTGAKRSVSVGSLHQEKLNGHRLLHCQNEWFPPWWQRDKIKCDKIKWSELF